MQRGWHTRWTDNNDFGVGFETDKWRPLLWTQMQNANEWTDVSISLLAKSETVHVMDDGQFLVGGKSKHHWKNMFNQFLFFPKHGIMRRSRCWCANSARLVLFFLCPLPLIPTIALAPVRYKCIPARTSRTTPRRGAPPPPPLCVRASPWRLLYERRGRWWWQWGGGGSTSTEYVCRCSGWELALVPVQPDRD